MGVDIFLSERPILPLCTVPILAGVAEVGALHIASGSIMETIERNLRFVASPGAILGVTVSILAD